MNKRIYSKWTPEEDDMIRQGIIPSTHPHYAACLLRARRLGFTFVKKKVAHKWSSKQDTLVRAGIIPPGRNFAECTERGKALGIDFTEKFYSLELPQTIIDGHTPKGMGKDSVITALNELNMSTRKFKVRKMSPSARKAYERGRELFLMHAKSSMSIQEIAQKEHVSRQNIHRLINRFKVYYFDEYCFDKVVTEQPKEENHEQ